MSPAAPLPISAGGFPERGVGRAALWRTVFLLVAIWAGIYLPTLGTLELKGEEGRRILPGQTMLRNGDWIVPRVGGEVYLRKPPMINWLAAISFKISGVENEWTARLPSVLGVLGLALIVFLASHSWLGADGAFAAAIFSMTNLGMMEKGRLLEIDALYSVAAGVAVVLWCRSWMQDRPWLGWMGIGLALAFGYLLKGPVHLLFFYAVAIGVLWEAQEMKKLFHPAHLAAVVVASALVLLWWVPYHQRTAGLGGSMVTQLTDRIDGSDFNLAGWALNIPRGLGNLLPWVVFLPFSWWPLRMETPGKIRHLFAGLRVGVVFSFLAVSLAPGSLPRYTMPVTAPLSVLLALTLTWGAVPESVWKTWRVVTGGGVGGLKTLAQRSGFIMVVLVAIYSLAVVPHMQKHSLWRSVGRKINAAIPAGETLYAVDPGSQPIFFYLAAPYQFVEKANRLPPDARYILARGKPLADVRKRFPKQTDLVTYQDRGEKTSVLVQVRR